MSFLKQTFAVAAAFIIAIFTASPLNAQLSTEMKQLYGDLIEIFDGDLEQKLQQALNDGEGFIELTPDQFKRFRDHPNNPLDGWDKVDPEEINGLIHLTFETEPVRSREPGYLERQHQYNLQKFEPTVCVASESAVRITNGRKQLAMGTIVSADGYIATKLSEIQDSETLMCVLSDGRRLVGKRVSQDEANDIALLQISAQDLTPAIWADEQPQPGAFVVTCGVSNEPLAIGIYSHAPRSLVGKNQAFLGVEPQEVKQGVEVINVTKQSAAEEAGLIAGDIITTLAGKKMTTVDELVNTIRSMKPGDKITVEFIRDNLTAETEATLAGRNLIGQTAKRFKKMNKYGAIPSRRASEFPVVFQHDTPLLPEQCGGPIVDLDGRVVGVNIARGGRVASYAIPADHVQALVEQLLRPSVAERPTESEKDR